MLFGVQDVSVHIPLLAIYMSAVVDQLPRLGKRMLICLLSFTCNYVYSVLFGLVSSSSWYLRWAALFYCGNHWTFHINILSWTCKAAENKNTRLSINSKLSFR